MKIVVFGIGDIFQQHIKEIDFSNIVCFIDNDKKKQGKLIKGKKILSLKEIGNIKYEKIIIFSTKYFHEIYVQLLREHISHEQIISWYFFVGKYNKVNNTHLGISSKNIVSSCMEIVRKKNMHTLLDMGGRLPRYGILNKQDMMIQPYDDNISFDGYIHENSSLQGALYNIYDHCYYKKGEVSNNIYDAIVFLDSFLRMKLEDCKKLIKDTFKLSNYVIINIPYGDNCSNWNKNYFLIFGDIEVFYYYDSFFLLLKKKHMEQDFCKIFVVTHKAFIPPTNKLYQPIQAGAYEKNSLGYLLDNEGDNISELNPWLNECTALYWMWKHAECEYIGLNHYRRYFLKDDSCCSIDNILDKQTIKSYIQCYDVILAARCSCAPNSSVNQMIAESVDKDAYAIGYKIVRNLLAERQQDYLQTFDDVMNGWSFYPCNMFVMRKTVMDAYCEWLFSFLIDAARAMDINPYDDYSKRIIGFFAERMLTVWLMQHQLKIKECPLLLLD